MNNKEFWDNVRPRLSRSTKISEIQRLYFGKILSYEDLIHLPVLDAKEIRERHAAELERQRKAVEDRKTAIWDEVLKTRALIKDPDDALGIGVSPKNVLVSVFIDGVETPFTDKDFNPVKLIGEIRYRDPAFYAFIKGRYDWPRLFNQVEKEF